MKRCLSLFAAALFWTSAVAQTPDEAVEAAREWRAAHGAEILRGFVELLSIPNDANDAPNIRRNADYVSALFAERGFAMQLLESAEAPPL